MIDLKKLPEHIQKILKDDGVNLDLEPTDNYEGEIKRKIKLPPSIIERRILVDIPKAYESYLYLTIDTLNPLYPIYLGIKKDLLQEHGAKPYWSSSKNGEFIKLRQTSKDRFINLIIGFADYFADHKQQEYKILKDNFTDIKNNKLTYNNSYGMPPVGKHNIPTEEWYEWYDEQIKSEVWKSPDKVKIENILNYCFHIQPREVEEGSEESNEHIKDIKKKVEAMDGDTINVNDVIIFEDVGFKFPETTKDDAVACTWHGVNGSYQAGAEFIGEVRVPDWVFEDKSSFFIRSAAAHDNAIDELLLLPKWPECKKSLKDLYDATGIEPESKTALQYLQLTYKNMPSYQIRKGIKKARQAINENEKPHTKHKYYTKEEIKDKIKEQLKDHPDTLCIGMSTGQIDRENMEDALYKDRHKWGKRIYKNQNNRKVKETIITGYDEGQNRKKLVVLVHIGEPDHKFKWKREEAMHLEKANFWLNPHEYSVEFITLDDRVSDVTEKKQED